MTCVSCIALIASFVAAISSPIPVAANGLYANLHIGDNGDGFGFNVDANGLDPASKDVLFGQVTGAGFGWIRQQVRWSAYEPAKGQFGNNYVAQVDALVNAASAKGVRLLLGIASSPGWAGKNGGLPDNPNDIGDVLGFMANRYKGKVAAYEIWNEQNYAVETGGTVNVGAYIPILKAGYQALKASDPNITVVFGGMTPTGVTGHPEVALDEVQYLQQLYAINGGEVKNYFDVLGAVVVPTCNPPDTSYPDNPATNSCGTDPDGRRSYTRHNAFYFKRILQVRYAMEQGGDGAKKMWLTEFGWDSTTVAVPHYGYGQYVSEDQQAQYLTRAIELGESYSWMGVMFVWNLNFPFTLQAAKGGDAVNDEKYGWGVLNGDGTPRAAYAALQNMAGHVSVNPVPSLSPPATPTDASTPIVDSSTLVAPSAITPSPDTGQPPFQPAASAPPSGAYDCPAGFPIKGNLTTYNGDMIYHVPGGQFYNATKPEACFATPADAQAAGYRASKV